MGASPGWRASPPNHIAPDRCCSSWANHAGLPVARVACAHHSRQVVYSLLIACPASRRAGYSHSAVQSSPHGSRTRFRSTVPMPRRRRASMSANPCGAARPAQSAPSRPYATTRAMWRANWRAVARRSPATEWRGIRDTASTRYTLAAAWRLAFFDRAGTAPGAKREAGSHDARVARDHARNHTGSHAIKDASNQARYADWYADMECVASDAAGAAGLGAASQGESQGGAWSANTVKTRGAPRGGLLLPLVAK